MKAITNIDDPRYIKALAHPLRIRLLAMLGEGAASPVQLANLTGISLGTVAYHVRTLHNLGLLELVTTRQRRGATEHVYKAIEHPGFSDEAWDALEPVAKQRMLSAILRQIGEYANRSAAAGGFDRADAHFTRTALRLDDAAWKKLAQATKEWLRKVDEIEQEVRQRLDEDPAHHDELFDVGLVLLLFEALPFSAQLPEIDSERATRRNSRSAH